jgi:hypothetical protein
MKLNRSRRTISADRRLDHGSAQQLFGGALERREHQLAIQAIAAVAGHPGRSQSGQARAYREDVSVRPRAPTAD